MNRKILFKAKRKDNGDWVEGYYVYCRKRHYILSALNRAMGFDEREDEWIEVDPDTLCQYTGLADKNDKKIWENDIVNCWTCIDVGDFANYHIEIGYVEMNYGSFGLHRIQDDTYYRPFKDYFEGYNLHIIGNIFDNPGMLEAE